MKSLRMHHHPSSEALWERYRTAFDEWALQVELLNQTRERNTLPEAQNRTMTAEAAYRESRNRLVDKMVKAAAVPESI
jgi:hypothetical protein